MYEACELCVAHMTCVYVTVRRPCYNVHVFPPRDRIQVSCLVWDAHFSPRSHSTFPKALSLVTAVLVQGH